jgi:hypothetical protein
VLLGCSGGYGGFQGSKKDGAGDEIRTRDINLGKVALYQLSYSRLNNANYYFAQAAPDLSNQSDQTSLISRNVQSYPNSTASPHTEPARDAPSEGLVSVV